LGPPLGGVRPPRPVRDPWYQTPPSPHEQRWVPPCRGRFRRFKKMSQNLKEFPFKCFTEFRRSLQKSAEPHLERPVARPRTLPCPLVGEPHRTLPCPGVLPSCVWSPVVWYTDRFGRTVLTGSRDRVPSPRKRGGTGATPSRAAAAHPGSRARGPASSSRAGSRIC
jgi:hypothetical protein